MLKNESEETKQQEVVYGKFYSSDSIKKPTQKSAEADVNNGEESSNETNIETCKE